MMAARSTRLACLRRARLAVAVLGALVGCTTPAAPPAPSLPTAPATPGDRALPAGAIAIGPDLYQVPIGEDAEGCMMYRLHSPTRMVTQAIAWRHPDGSFTLDRREAACTR